MIETIVVAGALALASAPIPPPPIAPDPCRGLPQCSEFGSADVTGDGRPDRIGYQLVEMRDSTSARRSTVRVIVTTQDGGRHAFDDRQFGYFEGPYGAAPIDGIPGAEIALSWAPGLHTSYITILTFRDGRLIKETRWARDSAAYGVGVEWLPGASAETPVMRQCSYSSASPDDDIYSTVTVDFTWQVDGWVRGPSTVASYPSIDRVPWQCTRFRVPGMARGPMNVYRLSVSL